MLFYNNLHAAKAIAENRRDQVPPRRRPTPATITDPSRPRPMTFRAGSPAEATSTG